MQARGDDGQATVEYVGLIALVALLLSVAGLVVGETTGVGERIVYTIREGLCAVAGVMCPTPAEACVVNRATTSDSASVTLGIVRLGEDSTVLRELRSDGRIVVTLIEGGHGGAEIGIGAGGEIVAGGAPIEGGAEMTAAAIARLGMGRSWVLSSAAAADKLIEQLGADETTPLVDLPVELADEVFGGAASEVRSPDIEWGEAATAGEASGRAGVGPLSVSATVSMRQAVGARVDHRTGRTTVYFALDGVSSASLSAKLLGGSIATTAPTSLAITFDRDGRPYELSAVASRSAEAVGRLPVGLRELASRISDEDLAAPGARLEVSARLDLTAPANVDAAKRLVEALQHPNNVGDILAAIEGLGDRLVNGSRLDARLYRTRSHALSAGGRARLGPGVGGTLSHRTEGATLVRAWSRPPDGVWTVRQDCLDAAKRLAA